MVNKLELTAKEKSFLNSMIGGNTAQSGGYRAKYGCDPCDSCGPASCADCKACAEGEVSISVNPFGQYR